MRQWTKRQRAAFYREIYGRLAPPTLAPWLARSGVGLRDIYVGRSRT